MFVCLNVFLILIASLFECLFVVLCACVCFGCLKVVCLLACVFVGLFV